MPVVSLLFVAVVDDAANDEIARAIAEPGRIGDTRSFHLHGGGDLDPCHHGRATAHPLVKWACAVTVDDPAVVLPDVPQLFLMVSFLAVAVLLMVPFRGRFLFAATGRGPPLTSV